MLHLHAGAGLAFDALGRLFQQRDERDAAGLAFGERHGGLHLRQHGAGGKLLFVDILARLVRRQGVETLLVGLAEVDGDLLDRRQDDEHIRVEQLCELGGGEVLVDGVNVKEYSLKHLREGVGMVLQKNILFSGTIEENLRWGNEDAPMEDVIRFSESAQADPFVKTFKNGYDTEMGQGGVNVSGGQKQRLCIARALLKRPKILILDDSTSAVDTATEAKIRESLYHDLGDTTKIIIAQRISSVQEADQILVLEDGRIIGHGTHGELLKTCEAYSEIYTTQIGNQSIGAGEEAAV